MATVSPEHPPTDPLWDPDQAAHAITGSVHFVEYTKPARRRKKNPIGFAPPWTLARPSSSADERDPAKVEDEGSNPS